MAEKLIRVFIAIDFPKKIVDEVARVQEIVKKKKFTGKLTELENLHLTLKFLGEIDKGTLEKVMQRLKKITLEVMELKLGRVGIFAFRGNPRIVWVKIEGKQIWELQKKIDMALNDLFKPEERFMGHLTIARVKYAKDKKGFIDYIQNIKTRRLKFKVGAFKLKSSKLEKTGPIYEDVAKYNLRGKKYN